MKNLPLLIPFCFFACGCMTSHYVSNYQLGMSSIEINGKPVNDSTGMAYRDSVIDIVWFPDEKMFSFELSNVSDNSFQVIWDQAAIVDENGISKRIYHMGIKYMDVEKSQPPTTVVKGSKIIDGVAPVDAVKLIPGDRHTAPQWTIENIYFAGSGPNRSTIETNARQYVGNTIKVLLPIKRGDKTTEYVFHFALKDTAIREERIPNPGATVLLAIALGIVIVLATVGQ